MEETSNSEECLELKNIKYITMLLKGAPIKETKSSNNLLNLENFLENEKNNNKNEPWCKLNKTIKIQKLIEFVDSYKIDNKLNKEEENLLILFFKDCLERKNLQRVKDVVYDKETGVIKNIPALHYTKSTKHFTLKNIEKRISTLKSLAPKKINTTIKNKNTLQSKEISDSDNENSDNDN